MIRGLIGFGIGVAMGLIALASAGAWFGMTDGLPNRFPPGLHAAMVEALLFVVFGWWVTVIPGMIGAAAGFGSLLVRPGKPPERQ